MKSTGQRKAPYFCFVCLFLLFLATPLGCRILVPWPGTEPVPPAVEAWSLNHWTTREVPILYVVLHIWRILKFEDMVLEEPHRTLGAWQATAIAATVPLGLEVHKTSSQRSAHRCCRNSMCQRDLGSKLACLVGKLITSRGLSFLICSGVNTSASGSLWRENRNMCVCACSINNNSCY